MPARPSYPPPIDTPDKSKLVDAEGVVYGPSNPMQMQQAQLTPDNDGVSLYVMSNGGVWVPLRRPNISAPHQTASLANNATATLVTAGQANELPFAVHDLTLFTTIAGNYSLWNGSPSGTSNLLARFGCAANTSFYFDFKGLIRVNTDTHLYIRNDTGNASTAAAIVAQTNIETLES